MQLKLDSVQAAGDGTEYALPGLTGPGLLVTLYAASLHCCSTI